MKLVILSDLHLPVRGIPFSALLGERVFAKINMLTTRRNAHKEEIARKAIEKAASLNPDHILITGDFSNMAHPKEFEKARALLKPLWDPKLLSVVPGNHDLYVAEGRKYFEQYFGELIWGATGVRNYPGYKELKDGVGLLLFRSPMYLPGPVSLGRVTRDQLVRAEAIVRLSEMEFLIAAFHHNIHKRGPFVELTGRLIGRNTLVRRLASLGVGLIVTGHDHNHREYSVDTPSGEVKVICNGSSSRTKRAFITEVHIEHGEVRTRLYTFSESSGEFL